jgi:hypothetical protein
LNFFFNLRIGALLAHAGRTQHICVRRGDVLRMTILCIIEVQFFVSSVVLKNPPERKSAKRYAKPFGGLQVCYFVALIKLL